MRINDTILGALRISASGLSAQRTRMNVISQNIANADTTRTEEGGPYRRFEVVLSAVKNEGCTQCGDSTVSESVSLTRTDAQHLKHHNDDESFSQDATLNGVQVADVQPDENTPFRVIYDPSHPDADADGYVTLPNVNVVQEMVDMISATRAYEANVTVMKNTKQMFNRALDIGRV